MSLTAPVVPSYSVIDMITLVYGDLDLIGQFLLDNPDIGALGIGANLQEFAGTTVSYTPGLAVSAPAPLSFPPPPKQTSTGYVTAQPTISIWDLVLQSYGSLDFVGQFISDNGIPGIDTAPAGQYQYNTILAQNQQMNQYNTYNNIVYATLWSPSIESPPTALLLMEIAATQGGPFVLLESGGDIALEYQTN